MGGNLRKIKGILAFLDWLLLPHGYDTWNFVHKWVSKLTGVADNPILRGYTLYKCKVCSNMFGATHRNKTCQNIVCFIKWRIK